MLLITCHVWTGVAGLQDKTWWLMDLKVSEVPKTLKRIRNQSSGLGRDWMSCEAIYIRSIAWGCQSNFVSWGCEIGGLAQVKFFLQQFCLLKQLKSRELRRQTLSCLPRHSSSVWRPARPCSAKLRQVDRCEVERWHAFVEVCKLWWSPGCRKHGRDVCDRL